MSSPAPRIAALDALRGLAALAVVVHHYWFLAPQGARPFESVLWVVYDYGRFAVPLFYLLSGYIFFSAYSAPIGEGHIDGARFFWLRASRLYPLQVLTVLCVAGLQALALHTTGKYFAISHNDLRHLLLNFAFLQYSWFDVEMNFNAPSWSLSIEAGLYVVFFVFARGFGAALAPRFALAAGFLALSCVRDALPLTGPVNPFFVEGLTCFFVGGCLQASEAWRDRPRFLLGWAVFVLGVLLFHLTGGRRETMPVLFAGVALVALASPVFRRIATLSPCVWLGDISYSTYLWHFPVQLALVVASATITPLAFSSPWILALYLAATLTISTLSFRYFEAPTRALLRRYADAQRRVAALPRLA